MRKIEVACDSVPQFELGDTVADIQWRREEKEARQMEQAQQQREEEARSEDAREEETHKRRDKDTEAGGKVGPS